MKYKVLEEHDSHFVVHDGKAPFKVVKKGLSKAMLGKIQQFADGGDVDGMTESGNIDLGNRPRVKNSDGSTSTVRSIGVNVDNQEVLIPTVSEDGRIMSNDEAIAQYKKTGRHLGKFDSPEASDAYAQQLHNDQADLLQRQPASSGATGSWSDNSAPPVPNGATGSWGASPLTVTQPDQPLMTPMPGEPNYDPHATLKPQPVDDRQPTSTDTPPPPKAGPSEIDKLVSLGQAGIKNIQQAAQQKAKDDEEAYAQHIHDIAALTDRTNQQLADNEHEADQLKQNIQDGKIDPNRLWTNAGTGNRAMAAIGIILGGMGGQGNGNVALDLMNKAIDRDIESQKEDVNNNKTLLNFNMKKYGDIRMAETATRIQLGSALQAQLGQSAARSGSLLAQGQAKMAQMQLQESMLPLKAQLAKTQVESQSYGGGMRLNSPEDQALMRLDPKYAEQRVPIGNMVYRHTGDVKAANEHRVFESKLAPIESEVNRLSQLGPSAAVPYTEAWNEAKGIRDRLSTSIAGLMSTEIGSSRINETEAKAAISQLSDPTSFAQMMNGGIRNQSFLKSLHKTADSIRSVNLIGYRGQASVPGMQPGWNVK